MAPTATDRVRRAWRSALEYVLDVRAPPPPTARTSSLSSRQSPRVAAVRQPRATTRIPLAQGRARRRQESGSDGDVAGGHAREDELAVHRARCVRRTSSCAGPRQGRRGVAGRWLICEWPSKESEPTKYRLSNHPPTPRSSSWCGWRRCAPEREDTASQGELGLTTSKGSHPGWNHRHAVSVAQVPRRRARSRAAAKGGAQGRGRGERGERKKGLRDRLGGLRPQRAELDPSSRCARRESAR